MRLSSACPDGRAGRPAKPRPLLTATSPNRGNRAEGSRPTTAFVLRPPTALGTYASSDSNRARRSQGHDLNRPLAVEPLPRAERSGHDDDPAGHAVRDRCRTQAATLAPSAQVPREHEGRWIRALRERRASRQIRDRRVEALPTQKHLSEADLERPALGENRVSESAGSARSHPPAHRRRGGQALRHDGARRRSAAVGDRQDLTDAATSLGEAWHRAHCGRTVGESET
jgi:hypothetical protein